MKNQSFIRMASKVLTCMAILFAMSPCFGKMYETEVPEELRK